MPAAFRLPLRLDSLRLKADLDLIQPLEWTPHYNEREYSGEWSGIALRSLSGSAGHIASHAADPGSYADTPLLDRCAYFREALAAFHCPLRSVRLLSLGPGSSIREHTDPHFEDIEREIRIHVPIRTNSAVEFYLDGRRLALQEGECYYIDASRPHRVVNRGAEHRVHLVIDAEVNEWLRHWLDEAESVEHAAPSSTSFDAFRDVVFGDVELQRALSGITDPNAFLDAVVHAGRERGFEFDKTEVHRTEGAVYDCPRAPGQGWLPVAVRFRNSKAFAKRVYFSGRLTEPFFETSMENALRLPFARAFQREEPISLEETVRTPAGFIFHMSRCGSTLVAQMLRALERSCVISEAPAIDDVIQAPSASEEEHVEWLRAVVSTFALASANPDLYFVKLDSWHIHKLPLIRRAFPATPWIFLYRDPLEVLVSQLRSPARLALPGAMKPDVLDMRFEDVTSLSRAEWCTRVLAGFCRSALRFRDDPNGLVLNYNRLPGAVWTTAARHFGTSFRDDEVARMRETACFDAKSPSAVFHADGDTKQRESEREIRDLAESHLRPLYLELEESQSRNHFSI